MKNLIFFLLLSVSTNCIAQNKFKNDSAHAIIVIDSLQESAPVLNISFGKDGEQTSSSKKVIIYKYCPNCSEITMYGYQVCKGGMCTYTDRWGTPIDLKRHVLIVSVKQKQWY